MSLTSFVSLYLAGLATFASPCVLPLLPIYVSVLGGSRQSSRGRLALAGIGFVLGLSIVFVALGMGASAFASSLTHYRRELMVVAGCMMVALGLQMLGVIRLSGLERDVRPLLARVPSHGGLLGGLMFGAAFSLGWTPCVGPVLAATLSYAASRSSSVPTASLQLAVYALGLSTPLVAAAFGASRVVAVARRLRAATPVIQRIMGAALVGLGLLLASDHLGVLAPSQSMVASTPPSVEAGACEFKGATACLLDERTRMDDPSVALPLGHPHLVEFVSRHCVVCAKMAPIVAELERACTNGDGTILRVDVESPAGRALSTRFGIHAVPTFLQLDADGIELERVIGEQSRTELALRLENVRGEACAML